MTSPPLALRSSRSGQAVHQGGDPGVAQLLQRGHVRQPGQAARVVQLTVGPLHRTRHRRRTRSIRRARRRGGCHGAATLALHLLRSLTFGSNTCGAGEGDFIRSVRTTGAARGHRLSGGLGDLLATSAMTRSSKDGNPAGVAFVPVTADQASRSSEPT
jgi:hypothetical protein